MSEEKLSKEEAKKIALDILRDHKEKRLGNNRDIIFDDDLRIALREQAASIFSELEEKGDVIDWSESHEDSELSKMYEISIEKLKELKQKYLGVVPTPDSENKGGGE